MELDGEINLNEKTTAEERLAKIRRFREEFLEFKTLFRAAFDELHSIVRTKISRPGTYIRPHSDYPKKSTTDSGFPIFFESGFYDDKVARDYVGTVRPKGLLSFLSGGFDNEENDFPSGDALKEFLKNREVGKKLFYIDYQGEKQFSDYTVDGVIGSAVEKYFHRHGTNTEIDPKSRDLILGPLMRGVVQSSHSVSLMVPIALTHFDFERYRLSDTTYLARIPERLQLSRARMRSSGSGASEQVVHAATHAFVSNGWTLDVDEVGDISRSLSSASENSLDAVDVFLGALRVATGVKTGFAQVIWVPRGWAIDYFCDLPPIYGTTARQYPSDFDDFAWTRQCPSVSLLEMDHVRRVYEQLNDNNSEAVRLATRRLSSCLTRSDSSDAVLDGTIGLELLLGDDQNQSLAYKLRLRAAALSWLESEPEPAPEIARKVKALYNARSAIVHGVKPKRKKKAVDQDADRDEENRFLAAELLRFVLRILLANPDYLEPSKIDNDLILRGETDSSEAHDK